MALQDKIGRDEIVNKICKLVDSLQKDQNFCLSLNGAWGSGKSFVLAMIEENLVKKQEYILIKYDAWENTFYSDPLIAILSCIIDGIDDKLYLVERYEEKVKKATKIGVNTLSKISAKIDKLKDVISGIKEIIKNFHNPIDTQITSDFKSYQKLLRETKEVLNEITQKGEYREKQAKLIILVDEIDRCLPDEQLKILERLHHLFNIKNCAVIVSMNHFCIAKTVQSLYGINGYEYLRKFFDFTFKLETSASEYLKNVLIDFEQNFVKLNTDTQDNKFSIRLAYQCLLYGGARVLDNADNRDISRYYNALLNICNDFGWEKLTQPYVFFIVIALYIRKNIFPAFLNEVEIIENQKSLELDRYDLDFYPEDDMPFYDYLDNYLGINRKDLPDEIKNIYRWKHSYIPEFSWVFNEIVYYSIEKDTSSRKIKIFDGKYIFAVDCQELRRLVILYGGEQDRNETNEK